MAEYTISKIELPNGDICNIKDTWRGIQDNLTSSSSTTESLSAKQGYLLANGSARDNTKVSKSGDRMTGDLIIGETSSDGTVISSGSFKIGAKNDNYGVMPFANNWNSLGASNLNWYRSYVMNYYGTTSYITNWASNNNIGTAASSSAASVKGLVNFYNECAAGGTQTKTALQASANSNITLTLPNATGTLALTSSTITGNAANVTGTVAVDHGGTGATTAAGARTNLELGTMATETAANYLKLSGGTMTGQLKWKDNAALPEKTSPGYFLVIDAFANGGGTYWSNKATVKSTLLDTNSTHSNQFLRKDGTWQTPPYPVTSVAGNTGAITADTLRTSLGLSNAMHFLGVTTTNVSTGTANTTATVAINDSNVTAAAGDVVIYGSQEYVWDSSKWNLLGDESSYKVKQTAVNDPTAATTTSTTFIDTISQDANGVITATKKTLPTASSTIAGITKVGASGGAAAYSHTHSYLANTNTGAADRPIYITGNAPAQTTYRMSGTNTTATAAIAITTDLPTGNWYVNGTSEIYNINDGVVYAEQYNSSWIHEIYGDYRTGQIAVRGKNNGTWQAWRKVLDSSNWKTLIGATTAATSATKYLREDGSWQVPVDTKNTAGSTNSTSKLYLIGATSQAANPTTNSYQYTYTDNGLLSALKVGLNLNGTEKAHLEWNDADQSIDFIFD